MPVNWIPVRSGLNPSIGGVQVHPGVFVIRQQYGGHVIPGKWPLCQNKGYVSYGGEEIELDDFEFLSIPDQAYAFLPCGYGEVPPGALAAGTTDQGEPLFIARGQINNEICAGKVHPSERCAFFPWGGKEHRSEEYEVLCLLD
ncbi:unnamed protein product [Calicophoron daubneyi]|uniref:DUF3421 domain-containing protein n=1 Tax=Calicophoron daubneyi TaxID=300641 RepID=A0AAV2T5Z6_CALDB